MRRPSVLWLSHFVPFPPKGGCFQRSYNLIARVAANHDIHLVAMKHKRGTHPEEETRLAETELRRYCRSVHIIDISESTQSVKLVLRGLMSLLAGSALTVTIFDSKIFRQTMQLVMREHPIDIAHLDTISLAQYLDDLGEIPAVMTHHGAESFMIRRRILRERNPFMKLFFLIEWWALKRYEQRMCPRVAANLVVSAADQEILAQIAPNARFLTVENGVDIEYFKPVPPNSARELIFAGRLDQYSNREGILFFMRDVWPLIRQTHPDTIVNIIGSNPPQALVSLAQSDSNVKIHGFVPDVRPHFQTATVAICPIRDGGGTRIKVLDALAQGIPIVSTSIACEGIEVVPGRDLLVADTPADFARQIARLFDDKELRATLASNARALAERLYAWDSIGAKLVKTYSEELRRHSSALPPHESLADVAAYNARRQRRTNQ